MRLPRARLLASAWVVCSLPLFGNVRLHSSCLAQDVNEAPLSEIIGEAATAVAEDRSVIGTDNEHTYSTTEATTPSMTPVMVSEAAPVSSLTPSPTLAATEDAGEVGGEADCEDSLDTLDEEDCDDELALAGGGEIGAEAGADSGTAHEGTNTRSRGGYDEKRWKGKTHGRGKHHGRYSSGSHSGQTQTPPNADQDNHQVNAVEDPDCALPIAKESGTSGNDFVGGEGDGAAGKLVSDEDPDCDEDLPYAHDGNTSPPPQVSDDLDCEDELAIPDGDNTGGDADHQVANEGGHDDALGIAGGDTKVDGQSHHKWGMYGHAGRNSQHGGEPYSFSSQANQESKNTDKDLTSKNDVAANVLPYPGG